MSGKLLPSQNRFHKLERRIKGFSGGVGSGKSLILCHEAIYLALQNEGRTGLIGAPTYGMLRDATLATFLEVCESSRVAVELNQAQMTAMLPLKQSKILFRSLENPERLRGSNLAWFGVDELTYCTEAAWTRLEARLRDPKAKLSTGLGVWTPKGFDWVYRRFVSDPVKGYGLVEAKPFENKYLLDGTPDYYERLKASYDPLFYRQEVLGEYINTTADRVYHAFSRGENVRETEIYGDEVLLWSLDFNINPMASVIGVRRGEEVYIVDEIVQRTSSTPEVCEEMARRYGERRAGVRVYGDASGRQRHTASEYSDYEVMKRFFGRRKSMGVQLATARSNPPVRDRVNLVNGRLEAADGCRRLYISSKCKELIKDLEQVTYKPDQGVIDKDRDPDRTHVSDALGYLLWQEHGAATRAGERNRPLF
jgi:phage terminase large subunit